MDVKMRTVEDSDVCQQLKQNEAVLEMTKINQELMEANQNLNVQLEKRECEFSTEIEVFI